MERINHRRHGVREDAQAEFRPIKVVEFDVSETLPDIAPGHSPDGRVYRRALALVRLHGEPLALVDLHFDQAGLPAERLATLIWPEIATRVRMHLAADDIAAPPALPRDGIVGSEHEPQCVAERNAFLQSAPPLSVLIPTRERPERLRRCLESILACEYPRDRMTIFVVDNAPSTSGTRDLVEGYATQVPIRYLREDAAGSASARNRGIREVETEFVVMTDDDTIVDRLWLTEIAQTFTAYPDAAVVSGLLVPMQLDTQAQIWFEQWGGFSRGVDRRVFDLQEHWPADEPLYPWTAGVFGTGNNFAFRTTAIREIHGFDPALGNGTPALGGVDTEILLRTVLSGRKIVYEPRAIVHHAHRVDYPALKRQIYGYGAGLIATWLKTLTSNPHLSLEFARKIPPGLRFALSPKSSKNAKKRTDFPSELTRIELRGMLYGPVAYARSRRKYGRHEVPRARRPRAPAP